MAPRIMTGIHTYLEEIIAARQARLVQIGHNRKDDLTASSTKIVRMVNAR